MPQVIPKNNKIIIFGASGFIGTHLINMLRHNNIIFAIDIKPPKQLFDEVSYITADVRNLKELSPINADIIFNLAAIHTTPGHSDIEYFDTNISGAIEVCSFAVRSNISTIIFTSSISVYGPNEILLTENSPTSPITAYGYSKLQAENIHKQWRNSYNSNLVICRPSVVYGPNECGNFTRLAAMLEKGFFIYPGRKNTLKACIYVKELINTFYFALGCNLPEITYNASFPNIMTIESIINTFKLVRFSNIHTFSIPKPLMLLLARVFSITNLLNFGIHPERINKLNCSTNIYPKWLAENNFIFVYDFETSLKDWLEDSGGIFI